MKRLGTTGLAWRLASKNAVKNEAEQMKTESNPIALKLLQLTLKDRNCCKRPHTTQYF